MSKATNAQTPAHQTPAHQTPALAGQTAQPAVRYITSNNASAVLVACVLCAGGTQAQAQGALAQMGITGTSATMAVQGGTAILQAQAQYKGTRKAARAARRANIKAQIAAYQQAVASGTIKHVVP